MFDIRPIILTGVVLVVPMWLIAKKNEDLLVKWICLTVAVDIFDPHLVVNLAGARVVGLLLLPSSLAALSAVRSSKAGNALWRYLIYLGCMGVVFGFIFPWASEGFDRLPTQLSQVRVVVYCFRKLADFSVAVFLARYLWKTRRPDRLIEWFVCCTGIAAAGGILQWLTDVDFYALLTGANQLRLEDRMRGFNYEPRGLGLLVGEGLLLAFVLYARDRSWQRMFLVLLHLVAMFLAVSTSGLFVVGAGLLALFIVDAKTRKVLFAPAVLILFLCTALLVTSVAGNFVQSWLYNVSLRLSSDKEGSASESGVEDFALRQDVFDASAIMMFASRPELLITGVGPGLGGLASTDYLPIAALFDWVNEEGAGLNSVPQVGLLREACDVGLVGLLLGWVFVSVSGTALRRVSRGTGSEAAEAANWDVARAAFWVAVSIYLVQASPLSASFSLFMAMGLTATWISPSASPVLSTTAAATV